MISSLLVIEIRWQQRCLLFLAWFLQDHLGNLKIPDAWDPFQVPTIKHGHLYSTSPAPTLKTLHTQALTYWLNHPSRKLREIEVKNLCSVFHLPRIYPLGGGIFFIYFFFFFAFMYTNSSVGKESACNAGDTGDLGLIPGLQRSPGGGHGNPSQYSYLENPTDRGAW